MSLKQVPPNGPYSIVSIDVSFGLNSIIIHL